MAKFIQVQEFTDGSCAETRVRHVNRDAIQSVFVNPDLCTVIQLNNGCAMKVDDDMEDLISAINEEA